MPPKIGAKRGANAPSARAKSPPVAPGSPQVVGERARVCLRIRPVLTGSEAAEAMALQCDRPNKLVWALGNAETGQEDATPKQFAFDDVLEQHVGQADVFDAAGIAAVQSAIGGHTGCVLTYGASGAGKDYSVRCERPGQEGLLLRSLALIFTGRHPSVRARTRSSPLLPPPTLQSSRAENQH